ncbi:MAG: hypothetical protein IJI13_09780, partial [Oscillospiraceae bacterium]|nr:hypothetical protein [Oscillospiraceae bacterium]
ETLFSLSVSAFLLILSRFRLAGQRRHCGHFTAKPPGLQGLGGLRKPTCQLAQFPPDHFV